MKYDEIMNERGFHLHFSGGSKSLFSYLHDESKVWCMIKEGSSLGTTFRFEFVVGGIFILNSGDCGSLDNDKHFFEIYDKFLSCVMKFEEKIE